MEHKKFEDLNVLDNFMFNELAMQEDKERSKRFFKILMETILQKKVRNIEVIPQRIIQGTGNANHGIQMDAYVEAYVDEDGNSGIDVIIQPEVFDFEPNTYGSDSEERRLRYYHALIDARILKKNTKYKMMKNVTLIMISNYDPFGYDRMLYTIERHCVEEPDMPYNDGSKTLYLYAYGKKDIPSQELANLLKYMAESTKENVVNQNLKDIQGMMDDIKMDSEKGVHYMQSWEIENICFEKGVAQGHATGLAEGLEQGRESGIAEGKQESILDLLGIFGEIPLNLETVIREEKRSEVLTAWLKVARRVDSISEFEESIHQE
jgi:predicted transposase/invertase (TIGR01784 family)